MVLQHLLQNLSEIVALHFLYKLVEFLEVECVVAGIVEMADWRKKDHME